MKRLYKIFIVAVVVTLLGVGCSSDFLDRYPKDTPSPGNFFANEQTAMRAALAGISRIQFHLSGAAAMRGGHHINNFDLLTDDEYSRANRASWYGWASPPTYSIFYKYWDGYYKCIASSNYALEGIPTSTDPSYDAEAQKPALAVAHFLRAWAYSNIVMLWGDAPLITKMLKTREEYYQPKSTVDQIYAQIFEDLEYANENLPESWPGYDGAPTKAASMTLLAREYLYYADYIKYGDGTGNADEYFQKARDAAENAVVVAANQGIVLGQYEDFWRTANEPYSGTIWAVEFAQAEPGYGNTNPWVRTVRDIDGPFRKIHGSGWGYALPQRDLYDEYEPNDPRREYSIWYPGEFYGIYHGPDTDPIDYWYIDENTGDTLHTSKIYHDGDSVFYNYKWSPSGMNTKKTEDNTDMSWAQCGQDIILSRLAELYLIAAEAYAELGDEGNTLKYVNMVRARDDVKLPPRALGDNLPGDGSLIDIVRHERRVELAMEGFRLFDMSRWGLLKTYKQRGQNHEIPRHFYYKLLPDNNEAKWDIPYGTPGPGLWPIPQNEIDRNDALTEDDQNPGYNQ
jgi:hypothetical protein